MGCTVLGHVDGDDHRAALARIAELEVAVRRGIAQVERLMPYVQWDGLDGEQDETNAHVTLDLMREALQK